MEDDDNILLSYKFFSLNHFTCLNNGLFTDFVHCGEAFMRCAPIHWTQK